MPFAPIVPHRFSVGSGVRAVSARGYSCHCRGMLPSLMWQYETGRKPLRAQSTCNQQLICGAQPSKSLDIGNLLRPGGRRDCIHGGQCVIHVTQSHRMTRKIYLRKAVASNADGRFLRIAAPLCVLIKPCFHELCSFPCVCGWPFQSTWS